MQVEKKTLTQAAALRLFEMGHVGMTVDSAQAILRLATEMADQDGREVIGYGDVVVSSERYREQPVEVPNCSMRGCRERAVTWKSGGISAFCVEHDRQVREELSLPAPDEHGYWTRTPAGGLHYHAATANATVTPGALPTHFGHGLALSAQAAEVQAMAEPEVMAEAHRQADQDWLEGMMRRAKVGHNSMGANNEPEHD